MRPLLKPLGSAELFKGPVYAIIRLHIKWISYSILWSVTINLLYLCSHWLTRVFLPSGHSPYGDGLTWDIYPLKKDMMPVWDITDLICLSWWWPTLMRVTLTHCAMAECRTRALKTRATTEPRFTQWSHWKTFALSSELKGLSFRMDILFFMFSINIL